MVNSLRQSLLALPSHDFWALAVSSRGSTKEKRLDYFDLWPDPSSPTPPHISHINYGIALIHWVSTVYQVHEAMCFVLALVFTITSELGK